MKSAHGNGEFNIGDSAQEGQTEARSVVDRHASVAGAQGTVAVLAGVHIGVEAVDAADNAHAGPENTADGDAPAPTHGGE